MGEKTRLLTAAVVTTLVLGACSSGSAQSEKSNGPGGSPSTTAAGAPSAQDGTAGSGTGSDGASGGSGGSGGSKSSAKQDGSSASTTAPGSTQPPLPLESSLAKSCVKAGGEQTITIKAPEGSGVGYDSYYADGKSGISEGFYGGNNVQQLRETDTWTDTWVIAANAPAGKVHVVVRGVNVDYAPRDQQDLYFDLVSAVGTCP